MRWHCILPVSFFLSPCRHSPIREKSVCLSSAPRNPKTYLNWQDTSAEAKFHSSFSFGNKEMGGGTEAFPDLGRHCQHPDCHQLDFLPFKCDGCRQVFCLEHRTHKSHECPKSESNSRKVVVCGICSTSIESTGRDEKEEKAMLERHDKSGECDPSKKKKPICPVRRCRAVLTFSNTSTCKTCQHNFCLKHRFPTEHACKQRSSSPAAVANKERWSDKLLAALGARAEKACANENGGRPESPAGTSHPIHAY